MKCVSILLNVGLNVVDNDLKVTAGDTETVRSCSILKAPAITFHGPAGSERETLIHHEARGRVDDVRAA